jgi:hypothetical protein
MLRERFKHMQDTYAQAMSKFGLICGKEGSEARDKFLNMDRWDKKEELATVETKLQKAKQEYEPYIEISKLFVPLQKIPGEHGKE